MTPDAVTDALIHRLVTGAHAEGITAIDVAAAIEDRGNVLLISNVDNDFEEHWDLPAAPVLPGESLLDALYRSLATLRLQAAHISGYLGHHDHGHDHTDDLIRVFCFAVVVTDAQCICSTPTIGHRWANLDNPPDLPSTTQSYLIEMTTLSSMRRRPSHSQPFTRPLRACAAGYYPAEAGVELLISHATWLTRREFVERFVHINIASTGGTDLADIDWSAALTALDTGTLPCSNSEDQILRLAASLAAGTPANLRDALASLDSHNAYLVSEAVLHANGHRPTGQPR